MVGGVIIVCLVALPLFVGAMAMWFRHREKLASIRSPRNETDSPLVARIDALEKKCATLQEQINDAHALLVDERRMLDQKLARKFTDGSAMIPDETTREKSNRSRVNDASL